MARKPVFDFTSTDRGWKVEIPSRFSPSGKRERAYFPTRDKANLTEGLSRLRENAVQLARTDARDVISRFGQQGGRRLAAVS